MNINNSLAAYRNIGSANINNGSVGTDGMAPQNSKTLTEWLEEEKPKEQADTFTPTTRPAEGALNLEPLERYRYMQNQAKSISNLSIATNDPKETIKRANEIINNAIMPTGEEKPDMTELTRALQIKQLMQGRLDIAA